MDVKGNLEEYINDISFFNNSKKRMSFDTVINYIINFMKKDPQGIYTLAIGTDSQVKSDNTLFVSAIMIYKYGKGAWGCMSKLYYPRRITSLREKISIETYLTQQLAYMFKPEILDKFIEIILPFLEKGSEFHHEVHIDIGTNGETRKLIKEMTSYFKGMGFDTKIKPNSYVASSYADRFTK